MTKNEAIKIAGNLGKPSKLPGYSYGLPAQECITGSKLRKVANSTCAKCYAFKGLYATFARVILPAQYKRLKAIKDRKWVSAMVCLITSVGRKGKHGNITDTPFFRWHDSGDLQSLSHLRKIAQVALALPDVKFWLPTREYQFVKAYLARYKSFPENLIVRLSAHKVDGPRPSIAALCTSGVHSAQIPQNAFICPASANNNQCGTCRACWNSDVKHVSYHLH